MMKARTSRGVKMNTIRNRKMKKEKVKMEVRTKKKPRQATLFL